MNKPTFWISAAVPVVLAILFFVILPARETVSSLPEDAQTARRAFTAEAFLTAQLAEARKPILVLSVDVVDSVATLSHSGVPLRIMPLSSFRLSRLIDVPTGTWTLPLSVTDLRSDIPHEPVRIVIAPKDTVEANARPPEAAPVPDVPTYAVLHVAGDGGPGLDIRLVSGSASMATMQEQAARHFNRGPATPWMEVVMAPEDIRAVYRAMAADAPVLVRLQ